MVTLFYRRDFLFSIYTKYFTLSTNNWNIDHPINADDIFDNANKLVSKDKIKILNFDDFDEILIFNLENN